MKTLRYLIFLAALAFSTTHVLAQASTMDQNNPDPNAVAQKLTSEVKRVVPGITTDQESQILTVETDFSKDVNAARTNSNGDEAAFKSKTRPLKETRDAKIKTILTSDQYAKYQKAESAHSGNSKGKK
jgi:hypothetical protein